MLIQARRTGSCKTYTTVGTLKLNSSGQFKVTLSGAKGTAAVFRFQTNVGNNKSGTHIARTFSLPVDADFR